MLGPQRSHASHHFLWAPNEMDDVPAGGGGGGPASYGASESDAGLHAVASTPRLQGRGTDADGDSSSHGARSPSARPSSRGGQARNGAASSASPVRVCVPARCVCACACASSCTHRPWTGPVACPCLSLSQAVCGCQGCSWSCCLEAATWQAQWHGDQKRRGGPKAVANMRACAADRMAELGGHAARAAHAARRLRDSDAELRRRRRRRVRRRRRQRHGQPARRAHVRALAAWRAPRARRAPRRGRRRAVSRRQRVRHHRLPPRVDTCSGGGRRAAYLPPSAPPCRHVGAASLRQRRQCSAGRAAALLAMIDQSLEC
jgi:hypothetical protein